jgi:hypothetical protein
MLTAKNWARAASIMVSKMREQKAHAQNRRAERSTASEKNKKNKNQAMYKIAPIEEWLYKEPPSLPTQAPPATRQVASRLHVNIYSDLDPYIH